MTQQTIERDINERANQIIDARYATIEFVTAAYMRGGSVSDMDIVEMLENRGFDSADIVDLLSSMPISEKFLDTQLHKEVEILHQNASFHMERLDANRKTLPMMEAAIA